MPFLFFIENVIIILVMNMRFYETIEKYNNTIIDLYVDMDGVLAEYDIGNFDYKTIRPLKSNIEKIKNLMNRENINIYILSICKTNSIIDEKIEWFKIHMPFLDRKNMILISKEEKEFNNISSKEIKSNYLSNHVNKSNKTIFVDDDNAIIKYVIKNNEGLIVFQVSSLID